MKGSRGDFVSLLVLDRGDSGVKEAGYVYKDYCGKADLDAWIDSGSVIVLDVLDEQKNESAPEFLKVGVDSSELEKALTMAKELEATLLRIKSMFA
jgi:hypothetical protein